MGRPTIMILNLGFTEVARCFVPLQTYIDRF